MLGGDALCPFAANCLFLPENGLFANARLRFLPVKRRQSICKRQKALLCKVPRVYLLPGDLLTVNPGIEKFGGHLASSKYSRIKLLRFGGFFQRGPSKSSRAAAGKGNGGRRLRPQAAATVIMAGNFSAAAPNKSAVARSVKAGRSAEYADGAGKCDSVTPAEKRKCTPRCLSAWVDGTPLLRHCAALN